MGFTVEQKAADALKRLARDNYCSTAAIVRKAVHEFLSKAGGNSAQKVCASRPTASDGAAQEQPEKNRAGWPQCTRCRTIASPQSLELDERGICFVCRCRERS
jgi:hypothetical protein